MKCPKCNHSVSEVQTVCGHCGEPIDAAKTADKNDSKLEIVYSRRSSKKNKKSRYTRNLMIIIVAALAAFAVVIGAIAFMRNRNKKEPTLPAFLTSAPVTTVPETTLPVTAAPATTVAATTEPATTLPDLSKDYEEKLSAYIRKTGLYNTLSAVVDGNTELSLSVERNMVMATYRVNADVNNEADEEYISSLAAVFEETCAQLDRYVYDMKAKSGVPTAVIQVMAFDNKSNVIFSEFID